MTIPTRMTESSIEYSVMLYSIRVSERGLRRADPPTLSQLTSELNRTRGEAAALRQSLEPHLRAAVEYDDARWREFEKLPPLVLEDTANVIPLFPQTGRLRIGSLPA